MLLIGWTEKRRYNLKSHSAETMLVAKTIRPGARDIQKDLSALLWVTAGVAALTAIIHFSNLDASVANVSMLYLLVVTLSALYLGKAPAVWASFLSFLAVNWFFVSPRYTFSVHNPGEWLTLCMFLFTAMVTGQLMALLKARALESQQRQNEASVLAEASWSVASRLDTNSALLEVLRQVSRVLQLDFAAVAVIDSEGKWQLAVEDSNLSGTTKDPSSTPRSTRLASLTDGTVMLLERIAQCSMVPANLCGGEKLLPVLMNGELLGAVYLRPGEDGQILDEHRRIVDSLVNHTAVILQRDRLMKAQTMAAALADADRLKTALLSMVSHDFRSPLTSIKASVSTMLSDGEPLDTDTYRSLCQAIEQETDRLNRMVGNILDLSRLEANAWRPRCELTSVAELIGVTLDGFTAELNQRIVVRLDPRLSEVYVDPVQMVQVVKNLVENALKYSTEVVEIESGIDDDSVPYLAVLDRGCGLPAGDTCRLFQPFYRAPDLQETSTPGVGIGLAVCKGLVEAHGCKLVAIRREGGGAAFRVTLNSSGHVVEK